MLGCNSLLKKRFAGRRDSNPEAAVRDADLPAPPVSFRLSHSKKS